MPTHALPPLRHGKRSALLLLVSLTAFISILAATSLAIVDTSGHLAQVGPKGIDIRPSLEAPASGSPISVTVVASPSTVYLGNVTSLAALVTGGSPWFSFAWAGVPPGCASSNESSLNCTPTATGTFTIGVLVTDSKGRTGTNSTTLVVDGGSPVTQRGSLAPGTIYLFAGALGIVTSVVTVFLIILFFRRRGKRTPMIPMSKHPYVPPQSGEDPWRPELQAGFPRQSGAAPARLGYVSAGS